MLAEVPASEPIQPLASTSLARSQGQTLYVPSYGELTLKTQLRITATSTLSIHNVDLRHSIAVLSVRSHDTAGAMLKEYLDKPLILKPLASRNFVSRLGSGVDSAGANFIVVWQSDTPAVAPLVESVILASQGTNGFSVNGVARVVAERH